MATKNTQQTKSESYHALISLQLLDPEFAGGYLSAALEEGREEFLLAIKDLARVRGGVARLASQARLNRVALQRMLSEQRNPRFSSIEAVMDALDLRIQFVPKADPQRGRE